MPGHLLLRPARVRLGPFSGSAQHGDGSTDYRKAEARVDDPSD